jgi:LysM repeat protein
LGKSRDFEIYLRTGRRRVAPLVELKFNPWHDPDDGRFTFAGQGRFFAGGSQTGGPSSSQRQNSGGFRGRGGSFGGGGAGASFGSTDRTGESRQKRPTVAKRTQSPRRFQQYDPRNPRNYSIHVVRRGESLTSIAAKRKGLKVADLVALNGISAKRPLRTGQRLKLPNQSYLDAGKEARDKSLALQFYRNIHGGRLPSDPANPPSFVVQFEAAGVRTISKNGYGFDVDVLNRTRKAAGEMHLKLAPRSKINQANAGKPDRRDTDDGGHFIAARFNGPRDSFNHFAQDANFNRGAYRVLEDGWAKDLRAGHRVFVDIVPHYRGTSKRPDSLTVTWFVDGKRFEKEFPNERRAEPNEGR